MKHIKRLVIGVIIIAVCMAAVAGLILLWNWLVAQPFFLYVLLGLLVATLLGGGYILGKAAENI